MFDDLKITDLIRLSRDEEKDIAPASYTQNPGRYGTDLGGSFQTTSLEPMFDQAAIGSTDPSNFQNSLDPNPLQYGVHNDGRTIVIQQGSDTKGVHSGKTQAVKPERVPVDAVDEEEFLGSRTNLIVGEATINGTESRDFLQGTNQSDTIDGLGGNDRIIAHDGDDLLIGGAGRDRLAGRAGDDTLIGGEGSDRLYGGTGKDLFVFDNEGPADFIRDFRFVDDKILIDIDSLNDANGFLDFSLVRFLEIGNHTLLQADFGNGFRTLANIRGRSPVAIEDLLINERAPIGNNAPEFTSGATGAADENSLATDYIAAAIDVDGDDIEFSITGGSDAALFTLDASNSLVFVAQQNFEAPGDVNGEGVYEVEITATDGTDTTSQLVTITLADVNEAPEFTSGATGAADENSLATDYIATATDVDGDDIEFSITGGNDAALFALDASNNLVFVAQQNFEAAGDANGDGVYEVEITATDGAETTTQLVAITLADVNDTPVVGVPLTATANEDDNAFSIDLLAGASDEDAGSILSVNGFQVIGGDASGITLNGNQLDIDPSAYDALNAGESAVITVQFDIVDSSGARVTQTASVTIDGADEVGVDTQAPVISAVLTGGQFTNDPSISITATDNIGIKSIVIMGNDGISSALTDITSQLDENGALTLNLAALNTLSGGSTLDGMRSFSIRAVDEAGNLSDVASLTYTLDRSAPSVANAPNGVLTDNLSRLEVQFDEALVGGSLSASLFSLVTETGDNIEIASTTRLDDNTIQLNLTGNLGNGNYTLDVAAGIADIAGNLSQTAEGFDFSVNAVTKVISVSPEENARFINVDREIIVEFDRPIDGATITSDNFQVLDNGVPIDGFIRVSANGLMATFFLDEGVSLPASSSIQVVLDGDTILDRSGIAVDVDGNGSAGGLLQTDFSTVSLSQISGTNLEGFIFDSNQQGPNGEDIPLVGVVVSVVGLPGVQAITDENGRFLLEDLPAPTVFLEFDASAVTAETGFHYGVVIKPVHTVAGQEIGLETSNGTPFSMYFGSIPETDAIAIEAGQETRAGLGDFGLQTLIDLFPEIDPAEWEKLQLTVPADALFFEDGTPATEVTVLAFDPSRIPAPLPQGYDPLIVFTVVAGGASNVDGKAQIEFPNLDGLAPGARRPIMSFDHDEGKWVQTGTAVVSADGTRLVSEGESGINTLGWKFIGSSPVTTYTQRYEFDDTGVDPTLELVKLSGLSIFRTGGEAAASTLNAGLTIADLIDAAVPDEATPAGPAVTATKLGLGLVADTIDDLSIDPKAQAASLALAGAGTVPVLSIPADLGSAALNADSAVQNATDSVDALLTIPVAAYQAANAPSTADLYGPRAVDIRQNGAVGPSGAQIRAGVTPTPINNAVANNAGEPGVAGGEERVATKAAAITENSVSALAQQIIEEYKSVLLNDVLSQFGTETQVLRSLLVEGERNIASALDIGQTTLLVGRTIDKSSLLLNNYRNDVDRIEQDFYNAAEAIFNSQDTVDQRALDFVAAREAYFIANEAAIDAYGVVHDELSDEIVNEAQLVVAELGVNFAALKVEIDDFTEVLLLQNQLSVQAQDMINQVLTILQSGQPANSFSPALRDLIVQLEATEATIVAAGFTDIEDWGADLFARINVAAQGFDDITIPFSGDLNPVYAQAILADGTIIRSQIEIGGDFDVNGPAGTEAIIRFFDPATNLFSEDIITFGEEATDGRSILSRVLTVDGDGDGIPDLGEEVIGSNPNLIDTDGDGITDRQEIILGTDINDAAPFTTGIIGSVDLDGIAMDIVVVSNISNPGAKTAYIATGSAGIAIVDVSLSTTPIINAQFDLAGIVTAIAVDTGRGLVYAAAGDEGLHIVDVSDPVAPFLTTTVDLPGGAIAIAIIDGLVLVGGVDHLSLIDPVTGIVVQEQSLDGDINDIFVSDGIVYIVDTSGTNANGTLRSYDVSLDEIVLLSEVDIPTPQIRRFTPEPLKLFIEDGVAYVATGLEIRAVAQSRPLERGGYSTFDVSDPQSLQLISQIDTGDNQAANYETVTNGSGLAMVAAGTFGLQLFDGSDPSNTFDPITTFDTPGKAFGVAVAGGIAYVADGTAGLQIINYVSELAGGEAPTITIDASSFDVDAGTAGIQIVESTLVTLDIDVADDVQVNLVTIRINGELVSADLSAPFESSFFITDASETGGVIEIVAEAFDPAGNRTASNTLFIDVIEDTIAPTLVAIFPSANSEVAQGGQAITVIFSERIDTDSITRSNLQLLPDGNESGAIMPYDISFSNLQNGQYAARFAFVDVETGQYTLRFDANGVTDLAGNVTSAGIITQELGVLEFSANWSAVTTGLWSDGENWSSGIVPEADGFILLSLLDGVDAIIDAPVDVMREVTVRGEGALRITTERSSDVGLETQSLTNTGNIDVTLGQLRVTDTFLNRGEMHISHFGSVRINSDILNTGRILIEGDILDRPSIVTDADNIALTGGGVIELAHLSNTSRPRTFSGTGQGIRGVIGQTLVNEDNTITGTGGFGAGFRFENEENGSVIARNGDVLIITTGQMQNKGLILAEAGGIIRFDSDQFFSAGFLGFRGATHVTSIGGEIRAEGGVIDFVDSTLSGVNLVTTDIGADEGKIILGGGNGGNSFPTLDGLFFAITAEARISIESFLYIQGQISNTGDTTIEEGASLIIREFLQLTGGGTFILGGSVGNEAATSFTVEPTEVEEFNEETGEFTYRVIVPAFNIIDHTLTGTGTFGLTEEIPPSFDENGEEVFFNEPVSFLTFIGANGAIMARPDDSLDILNVEINNNGTILADAGVIRMEGTSLFVSGDVIVENGGVIVMLEPVIELQIFPSLFNDGLITVRSGGEFRTELVAINRGIIEVENGSFIFENNYSGASGLGLLQIGDGIVTFSQSANGRVHLGFGDANVIVESGEDFDATLINFEVGDTIHLSEIIDFASVQFTLTEGADTSVLTISDGVNDAVDIILTNPEAGFGVDAASHFFATESMFTGTAITTDFDFG